MPTPINLRAVNNDQLRELYRTVLNTNGWAVEITRSNHVVMTGPEGQKTFGPLTTSDGARVAKNVTKQLRHRGWIEPVKAKTKTLRPESVIEQVTVPNHTPTFQHGVLEYEKPEPSEGVTPMPEHTREDKVLAELRGEELPPEKEKRQRGLWTEGVSSLTRGLKVEAPPKQRPRGRTSKGRVDSDNKARRSRLEEKGYQLVLELLLTAATEHPDQWVRVPGQHPHALRSLMSKVAKELDLKVRIRQVNPGKVQWGKLPKEEQKTTKLKFWIRVTENTE